MQTTPDSTNILPHGNLYSIKDTPQQLSAKRWISKEVKSLMRKPKKTLQQTAQDLKCKRYQTTIIKNPTGSFMFRSLVSDHQIRNTNTNRRGFDNLSNPSPKTLEDSTLKGTRKPSCRLKG